MKIKEKDKFVFSQRNANMFGYNIGMTKDGKKFSYTTVINTNRISQRQEYEIEGETVYIGTIEDLIAIKRCNGIEAEYIKNTTNQVDPLNGFLEEKPNEKKECCEFTKNFCNKIKELNKKFMKSIEKEYNNNSKIQN